MISGEMTDSTGEQEGPPPTVRGPKQSLLEPRLSKDRVRRILLPFNSGFRLSFFLPFNSGSALSQAPFFLPSVALFRTVAVPARHSIAMATADAKPKPILPVPLYKTFAASAFSACFAEVLSPLMTFSLDVSLFFRSFGLEFLG
jgi:hypothetical protein